MLAKLEPEFMPMVKVIDDFKACVAKAENTELYIAVERNGGLTAVYKMDIYKENTGHDEENYQITERIIKTLLWAKGGFKVFISGSKYIYDRIADDYRIGGAREFDCKFMSRVYEKEFKVVYVENIADAPRENDVSSPVDFNKGAMVDEWSGDYGCGVKYFSQDAVIKLAPRAGIELDESLSPAEKLKVVQGLMEKDDERAADIYDTIGTYFGYAIAYYSMFYDIKHMLIMGRVTSGKGGAILLSKANEVLKEEYPGLYNKITLHIPDEKARRVGQSVAAASLPQIK